MSNLLKFKKRIVSEETKQKISASNRKTNTFNRECEKMFQEAFIRECTRKVVVLPISDTMTASMFYDQFGELIHIKMNNIKPAEPKLKLVK